MGASMLTKPLWIVEQCTGRVSIFFRETNSFTGACYWISHRTIAANRASKALSGYQLEAELQYAGMGDRYWSCQLKYQGDRIGWANCLTKSGARRWARRTAKRHKKGLLKDDTSWTMRL